MTVYLPTAHESVLKTFLRSLESAAGEAIKRYLPTERETERPPPPVRPTFTPSQRELNNIVFTYMAEVHVDETLTKGGGLKTKSEALAL